MTDREKAEMLELIQQAMKPVIDRLDAMDATLSTIKEDTEITRSVTNKLIPWAEEAAEIINVPLFPKASNE